MQKRVLLLTLKVFSATGGIEKVCRVAGKALYEQALTGPFSIKILSMYDRTEDAEDNPYFPTEIFKGFKINKMRFIKAAVDEGRFADIVILSHINLLLVGWMIKKISPHTKVLLFAHGIEIWGQVSKSKSSMLRFCDKFICVSQFTKDSIVQQHTVEPAKCAVLNNCIDPYLPLPSLTRKDPALLAAHGFTSEHLLLFTLTRLSSKDRYKGYDKVFEALALLKEKYPNLRYLVGGGYDDIEKAYVDAEVIRLGLQQMVTITGYIPEEELAGYFAMADIYVMPSRKEGFGIVFVEAMFYGLPVIAGNVDGSVDALLNGELGLLVNPESIGEVRNAVEKILDDPLLYTPDRKKLMEQFSYESYKEKLGSLLVKSLVQ